MSNIRTIILYLFILAIIYKPQFLKDYLAYVIDRTNPLFVFVIVASCLYLFYSYKILCLVQTKGWV